MIEDQRARLLRAAAGFALVREDEPELRLLHRWLDSWRGIGDVVVGMARQGWDLQLSEYDAEKWRATFFVAGQGRCQRVRGRPDDAVVQGQAEGVES